MSLDLFVPIAVFLTSLISGVFGMAGGLILMAIYSSIMPIELAMILHGYTQLFSNGFRSFLFKAHIQWKIIPLYLVGSFLITMLLSWVEFRPSKQLVLILLGLFPFTFLLKGLSGKLDITQKYRSFLCGSMVSMAQLLAGASGSILDIFFINSPLNKFEIMGTKAITQSLGHILKIAFYFSLLNFNQTPSIQLSTISILAIIPLVFLGGGLGKMILSRFSEEKFRMVSKIIIMLLGVGLFIQGVQAFTQ